MSKNNTTSANPRCSVHYTMLASIGRHAQLTRCFSAVAELLVICGPRLELAEGDILTNHASCTVVHRVHDNGKNLWKHVAYAY